MSLAIPARRADGTPIHTVPQLCDALGITYRQLDHWCRSGFIHPDEATPGTGNPRSFSVDELRVLTRMARLVNDGMKPSAAAVAARRPSEADLARRETARVRTDAALEVAWRERGECA